VNLKTQELAPMTTSKCVGADTLLALLANYCRNRDVKTSIRVGVVGMPNVGKSSLINSLKRSKAGLAIKNSPKKTQPTKNGFFGVFLNFFNFL
jgi:nuclear GTP-binding protein